MSVEILKKIKNLVGKLVFTKRMKKINKDLFIRIVERNLIEEHKEEGGVYIPEFLEARSIYEDFKRNDCFDENGYLKSEHLKQLV